MAPRRTRVITSDDDDVYEEGSSHSRTPERSIKTRRSRSAAELEEEGEGEDEFGAEYDGDGAEGEGEGEGEEEEEEEEEEEPGGEDDEGASDEQDNPTSSATPQRFSIVIKRRGRGRGRGGASSGSSRGTVTRGRPRGRPRGRGRGALPHNMMIVQKGVNVVGEDGGGGGEDDDYVEGASKGGALPIGTTYRQIQGKYYVFEDDELKTEEDDVGNTKIDINGNLLGGRVFKADTFCSPWRANQDKRYMLSIEAARTSGFRDSLYYFRRNPLVVKLTLSQAEKDHLISLGRLSTTLKSRSVTIVTARSAFKLHGSKMVKEGRWVTDDYYEDRAKAECLEKGNTPGELVGELPDLNLYPVGDISQPLRTLEERRAAAGMASAAVNASSNSASGLQLGQGGIYRSGGPTTHFGGAGLGPFDEMHMVGAGLGVNSGIGGLRRQALLRDGVTEDNWMWKIALRVHDANDAFQGMRVGSVRGVAVNVEGELGGGVDGVMKAVREAQEEGESEELAAKRAKVMGENHSMGAYEPHTDMFHYRTDSQPTRAQFEQLVGGPLITGEKRVGGDAWGVMVVDTEMILPDE